jgi:hypothetical protein
MAKRDQQMSAREDDRLHGQLTAYSAAVRISGAAGSLHRRFGNWPIYAAATGSALAMATGASASIITGSFNSPNSVTPKGSSVSSSIKGLIMGSAGRELNIKANSGVSANGPWAALSVQAESPVRVFVTSTNQENVLNFAKGVKIAGNHGASQAKIVNAFFSGSDFGDFKTAGQPGYAGLAIAVGGGNFDYGWVKLEFTDNPETSRPYTLTALAFGIELTANKSIDAGQTTDASTPEPGTMALSLLASGATGIMAWKRRRKQNAAL